MKARLQGEGVSHGERSLSFTLKVTRKKKERERGLIGEAQMNKNKRDIRMGDERKIKIDP